MSEDLIFSKSPLSQPADLVFGETEAIADHELSIQGSLPGLSGEIHVASVAEVSIAGTLPTLGGEISVGPVAEVSVSGALPGLSGSVTAQYDSATDRPLVGRTVSAWQEAKGADADAKGDFQGTQATPSFLSNAWQEATAAPAGFDINQPGTFDRTYIRGQAKHKDAIPAGSGAENVGYANMLRGIRPAIAAAYGEAISVRQGGASDWQDMLHYPRPTLASPWGETQGLLQRMGSRFQKAAPFVLRRRSRYQDAIVPPPGVSGGPTPPAPGLPCYTPPDGDAVHLLFKAAAGDTLLFICENKVGPNTKVVPIRSVYMVINDVSLKRVADNLPLPTFSLSLSIDASSWTWGFSATLPVTMQDNLMPSGGVPVELEANINGNPYRVVVESITRERTFGNEAIRVSGRGKSALLAAPYTPMMNFSNSIERSANQLMEDVLMLNGVPIGWDIDWQITDWLVPAGVWNHRGDYITALNAIASAAGAYIQPHPTAQEFSVLARYPVAPWLWETEVTPDFILPVSVTTQEGIEWLDKPLYNRVYVSGISAGVLGRVTREGTAGDLVAEMVADALITQAPAARQRGISILGDTGRQALVTLKLPVLDETGVITPGKFVSYNDGSVDRLGIVRSTSVDATSPEAWQSILLETHG